MKYIEKRWVCNSKRCGKVWDFHGDFMVIFGIDGAGFMVIFGSFVNFFVNIEVLAGCFFFLARSNWFGFYIHPTMALLTMFQCFASDKM